jgi:hypothetical protein
MSTNPGLQADHWAALMRRTQQTVRTLCQVANTSLASIKTALIVATIELCVELLQQIVSTSLSCIMAFIQEVVVIVTFLGLL